VAIAAYGIAADTSRVQTGLTAAPLLASVYDAIMDARFDSVPALLGQACGPAPKEACQVLEAAAALWRIQLDPFNRTHDGEFRMRAEAAIVAAEAWTVREPERAETWFYLGGAYGARIQWRALRGERLAAARDGKRTKDALERAVALDPAMDDAYFGIGLYHYYADIAPTALKVLRWLLLMPGGDRARGLEQIERARRGALLVGSEAEYQLHLLYLWYEKQPQQALQLLEGLAKRHPGNPLFLQAAAEAQDVYLHDHAASLRTWEALLDRARSRTVADADLAETAARLGIALQLCRLSQPMAAIPYLRAVVDAKPATPFEAVARAQLQLGDAFHQLGRNGEAAAAYRAAISEAGPRDPLAIAAQARARLRAIGG
jgi:tetratricopeptide (TPR) repeat protein